VLRADKEMLPSEDGMGGDGLGECRKEENANEWGMRLRARMFEHPDEDIEEL
jgi:hypothetical protein